MNTQNLFIRTVSLLLFLLIPVSSLFAQDREELQYRKWRVTLFTPIGTNGVEAPDYTARYSINLLYGYHGGLDGIEVGTLFNITKKYSNGFMLAGLGNISGGPIEGVTITPGLNASKSNISGLHFTGLGNVAQGSVEGLILSGFGNISRGSIEGLTISGVGNIAENNIEGLSVTGGINASKGDIEGLHITGLANISGDDQEGLIMAGLFNTAGSSLSGLTLAGGFNVAKNIEGLTASGFANIGQEMEGLQFSGLNLSRRSEGLQIGLINLAREFEGMPVGLFSLYGNGRKNIDLRTSDAGFTEAGLNLGTYRVSNMLIFGFNNALDRDVYRIGWSLGLEKNIKDVFKNAKNEDWYVNQELSVVRNFENEIDFDQSTNLIWSFKYLFGKRFSQGFSVYGGPTLNMQVTRVDAAQDYTWYSLWSPERKGRQYRFWVGFNFGMRLFKQKVVEPIDYEWHNSW